MKVFASVLAIASLGLGACSTASPLRMAEAAPITHRVGGDTGMRVASVEIDRPIPAPRSPVLRTVPMPDVSQPVMAEPMRPVVPEVIAPVVEPEPGIDFKNIDRELYAHQRVGKTYKVFGKSYKPKHQPDYDVTGTASWYGPKFHGKPTASGETFDMEGMTAAHKTLPLQSLVQVTSVATGESLIVRINDRGPFVGKRVIDLSKAAARELGLLEHGLKTVRVRYVGPADPNTIGDRTKRPVARIKPPAQSVAAAPDVEAPAKPQYTPLRRLPGSDRAMPTPAPNTIIPDIAPREGQTNLPEPEATAPTLPMQPNVMPEPQDGPLTLTIKGPIHLARSQSMPNAEYVRAASHD